MAQSRLWQVSLVNSDVVNQEATIVSTLQQFQSCRRPSAGRPGGDVRIMFKSDGSRTFIKPFFVETVVKEIRKVSSPFAKLIPSTCIVTWKFPVTDTVKLLEFDDFCQRRGVHNIVQRLGELRFLVPHHAEEFMRKACTLANHDLERYFVSFQHICKNEESRRDRDEAVAEKLFTYLAELDKMETEASMNDDLKKKFISVSGSIQTVLNNRMVGPGCHSSDDADQVLELISKF